MNAQTYRTESFISWLNDVIRVRDLSKAEISRLTGLDRSVITRLLNGDTTPMPETLNAIADGLGIPRLEVFRRAGFLGNQEDPKQLTEVEQLAHRISLLPKEDQDFIDSLIESLAAKRGGVNASKKLNVSGLEA